MLIYKYEYKYLKQLNFKKHIKRYKKNMQKILYNKLKNQLKYKKFNIWFFFVHQNSDLIVTNQTIHFYIKHTKICKFNMKIEISDCLKNKVELELFFLNSVMSGIVPEQKSAYFVRKTPTSSPNAPSKTSPTGPTSPAAQKPSVVLNIPGTKTSLQNSQLLTPIGIPSIDSFIGK